MVIDVRKLKNSGKDGCSFCFEYAADDSLITLPQSSFKSPVTVTGELELAGDKAYVNGDISYTLIAPCSRCGEKTEYVGLTHFDEVFSDDPYDANEDFYPYSKGLVDLTKMVCDALVISFPYTVYCDKDKEDDEPNG